MEIIGYGEDALSIERVTDPAMEKVDLNDHDTGIRIERV